MQTRIARQPLWAAAATFAIIVIMAAIRAASAPLSAGLGDTSIMPLAALIDSATNDPILRILCGALILALNAYLVTRIAIIYKLAFGRSYLPVVLYGVAAAGIVFPASSIAIPLCATLLIVSSGQAISAFRRRYRFPSIFRASFLLGFMPLLYAPAICLVPVMAVVIILYQRSMREVVVAIVAFFAPLLLCSVAWWIAGYPWGHIVSCFAHALTCGTDTPTVLENPLLAVPAALYLAAVIWSVVMLASGYSTYPNRVRKIYLHFIFLWALSALTFLIPSGNVVANISLMAVPSCFLAILFFAKGREMVSTVVYVLLVFSSVVLQVIGL